MSGRSEIGSAADRSPDTMVETETAFYERYC